MHWYYYDVTHFWFSYFILSFFFLNTIPLNFIAIMENRVSLSFEFDKKIYNSTDYMFLSNTKFIFWVTRTIRLHYYLYSLFQTSDSKNQIFSVTVTAVDPVLSDNGKSLLIFVAAFILWYKYGVTYFGLTYFILSILFSNTIYTGLIYDASKKVSFFSGWNLFLQFDWFYFSNNIKSLYESCLSFIYIIFYLIFQTYDSKIESILSL